MVRDESRSIRLPTHQGCRIKFSRGRTIHPLFVVRSNHSAGSAESLCSQCSVIPHFLRSSTRSLLPLRPCWPKADTVQIASQQCYPLPDEPAKTLDAVSVSSSNGAPGDVTMYQHRGQRALASTPRKILGIRLNATLSTRTVLPKSSTRTSRLLSQPPHLFVPLRFFLHHPLLTIVIFFGNHPPRRILICGPTRPEIGQ